MPSLPPSVLVIATWSMLVSAPLFAAPAGAHSIQAAQTAQAAAPATYATEAALKSALTSASGDATDMKTSPVSVTDQYRINLIHRVKPAGAIAHAVGTEVHHITDGAGTFVTGGVIKGQGAAATIEGGVSRRVAKGDVILVPENTPHWYKAIEGSISYLEIRFNAPAPK